MDDLFDPRKGQPAKTFYHWPPRARPTPTVFWGAMLGRLGSVLGPWWRRRKLVQEFGLGMEIARRRRFILSLRERKSHYDGEIAASLAAVLRDERADLALLVDQWRNVRAR